jgi:uncharacterized membrane protein SpoIIM required for sporulation
MTAAGFTLKSHEFRREREATWRELAALLERVEGRGLRDLSGEELHRLPVLYRATVSSLSVARAISLDRNVVDYLEALTARAYIAVYGSRLTLRRALAAYFLRDFPRAVRRYRRHLAVAALVFLAGAAVGMVLTLEQPDRFYTFVADGYAGGRDPAASTETLRRTLYDPEPPKELLGTFASWLFTHNATIGLVAFALGFVAGVPVFILYFLNGLVLGAFAALFQSRDLGADLWGWLLPHGVTEILALALCGAAGLALGQAVVFPGRLARVDHLAQRGRAVAPIVIGAVLLFFIAAMIEGFFRQLVLDMEVRYAVAAATAALWTAFFSLAGRRGAPA